MIVLRTGNFECWYDNGFIRHVSHGGAEILRMIYFALRDHNWNTIPYRIENEKISKKENSFQIDYQLTNFSGGKDVIQWKCKINGDEKGKITFEIAGNVLVDFMKNRAGFCVLHPIKESKEAPVEVTDPAGTKTHGIFPSFIAPENPFKNIRSMKWRNGNHWFSLHFDGDIFETEDQRNWADASFKTFCTPGHLPKPAKISKGDIIGQRVVFSPEKMMPESKPSPRQITLERTGEQIRIPNMGLYASTEIDSLSLQHIATLKALKLHHYRIDVTPAMDDWVSDFSRQYTEAFTLGLPLEVSLHLSENFKHEAEAFGQLCRQNQVRLYKVLLLSVDSVVTNGEIIELIHSFRSLIPEALIGAGTDYNFTEINMNRINHGSDFVSFSLDPQEHAVDDLTVIENLEGFYETVSSARKLFPSPIHISTVTLRKRNNPYASSAADKVKSNDEKADPRQLTGFGAAWTFGSVVSLAEAGAESVTLFQTTGRQGVISLDNKPYPVFNIIQQLSEFQNKRVWKLRSSDPLYVKAFADLKMNIIALTNLSSTRQEILFQDQKITLDALEVRIETLNSPK